MRIFVVGLLTFGLGVAVGALVGRPGSPPAATPLPLHAHAAPSDPNETREAASNEVPTAPADAPADPCTKRIMLLTQERDAARVALASARTEAETFERGLTDAVNELNRIDTERRQLASALGRGAARAHAAPSDPHRLVLVRQPAVSAVGNTVVVAGRVQNASAETVRGTLVLRVTRNRREEAVELPLTIAAHSTWSYSEEVRMPANGGDATVDAQWVPAR